MGENLLYLIYLLWSVSVTFSWGNTKVISDGGHLEIMSTFNIVVFQSLFIALLAKSEQTQSDSVWKGCCSDFPGCRRVEKATDEICYKAFWLAVRAGKSVYDETKWAKWKLLEDERILTQDCLILFELLNESSTTPPK